MFEQDAARLIRAQGWQILRGPFYNANLARKGLHVWTIKSVLSKDDLKKRGIKPCKAAKADSPRTVRFLGDVRDGVLVEVQHLTSSARKKLGSKRRRRRKDKKDGGDAS